MTTAKIRKADAIVATIEARILNGDYRPGTCLDERSLAEEFGVSAERIRQIEQKAMQKMKTLMLASR